MAKKDKALTPVEVGDLVFEEETPKPVLTDDLVFEDTATPTSVMEGGIDHALPVGFGQGEATKPLTPNEQIDANDKAFAKAVSETVHNVTAPMVEGAEKLLNKIPGVKVDFSSTYDPKKVKEEEKQSDLSYETYDLVGKLAHTDINLADATPEDAKKYNDALYHVVVDKLGHKDLGFDSKKGEYVVVTKSGDKVPLNQSTMKSILADGLGDKYELTGAMAGAKLGLDATKAVKNPYLKGAGLAIGSAIGAGTGSLVDTFSNAIETGQKLTAAQYGNEANKAIALDLAGYAVAPLVIKGVVAGAKGTYKASKNMVQMLDKAKKFDLNGYAQKRIIDDMAKLPEAEQGRYLDALDFAKENNIKLTSTSVIDHPQIDQLVQVLARNPFIRQGVKNLESKSRDKLIAKVFDVLESAGPKATSEELDPLLKQELSDALLKRNAQVRAAYDDFEHKVSGQVVTKAKGLLEDVSVVGDKYGFRDEAGVLLDEDIVTAEKYVKNIFDPRAQNSTLDAKVLDKISANFGKRASAYKTTNPKLHAYYSEVKGLVDNEIQKVSAYEGDEVAKALNTARKAYKEKVGIYGNKSEFSEIRKAMESDRPNEAINALLSGEKGLDNANMLKQELGGTEAGDALLGALGRKHMDDALEQVDMKSPSAVGRMLSSDKMKVAKRLLGEKRSADLDNIATLMEMMGRTEKLLAGAGSEIATASTAPLTTKVVNGIEKMMVRLQQERLFGKVFDNTLAQDMLHKTLVAAQKAKTPKEIKRVDAYLRQTAKTLERSTGEDFSDIYDKRKIRQLEIVDKKAQQAEAEALDAEIKAFEMPDTAELLAVGKVANNDDVVRLNQSIGRLQKRVYSDADVERYLKARKSLDDETFSKAYEKERVQQFPAKFRDEDLTVELEKMGRLRDYLLSNPQLKYGNEFNPNSVKALMNDLREKGVPRSTEHDKLYDDMKEMYTALKANIDEAYPKQSASVENVLESPLDANGNSVFSTPSHLGVGAGTGTVNAFTHADANGDGTVTQEEFVQAFLLGLAGGTAGSKAITLGLKKINPELFTALSKAVDDGVDAEGIVGMFKKEKSPKKIELDTFGENFAEFASKPKEAVEKLIKEQKGQVKGALYHPQIGEIDLVWGEVLDADKHTGYGLSHIIDKHGIEVARRLDDIVMGGKILRKKGNTVEIINGDDLAVIKLDWNGEDRHWVVTTFDMPPRQSITDDVALVGESGNLSPKANLSITQKTNDVKKDAE